MAYNTSSVKYNASKIALDASYIDYNVSKIALDASEIDMDSTNELMITKKRDTLSIFKSV